MMHSGVSVCHTPRRCGVSPRLNQYAPVVEVHRRIYWNSMPLSNRNSERLGSRYRSAASHHSTTLHMSIEVGYATASHKSAEGRYIHYERSHLTVVEKRGAVKRECARAEGVGSGERKARTAKQPQGPAREPQPSEFYSYFSTKNSEEPNSAASATKTTLIPVVDIC